MIHVVTWLWGDKYGPHYVERLRAALDGNLPVGRFFVAKPPPEDEDLTRIPGCFARLRTFSPDWQRANGIEDGDTIVVLDLDIVVTGDLARLFDRPEPFVILQGVNASNPCRFNGSVWMLRAGYRPDVWSEFSLARAAALPFWGFPDDQRWLEHKLPDAGAFGPQMGVYGFNKPGWPPGTRLPANARLVAFFGWRDPSKFTHLDWVRRCWGR